MPPLVASSFSPVLPPPAPSRARFRVAASADVGANGRAAAAAASAVGGDGFPPFLPRAVERIRDGAAIRLAKRIERVPVQLIPLNQSPLQTSFSKSPILSSCVRPLRQQQDSDPVVLLHGFDRCSSCLEWRYTYPLLEEAGLETWAVDILGWGFSNLETRPPCDVGSKREHLYQFWKSYIRRPMVLVGPSLGAAVAIDFAVHYPEAVSKLIFIGASVYAEGTKDMTRLPKFVPYAGVKHRCLVLWGEDDGIISNKQAYRLQQELPSAILRQVGQCGHIPHVEKPREAAKHLLDFLAIEKTEKADQALSV
ncbi:hypothetical protein BRADI_1g22250v3 [Brachypodium distachyon]|uniref:AB hydrolase-1 domain-containing protein n=1 Tax=Brachypodium distachyon TaxID=15368 RepID=A0A0Q3RQR1_BRADI|nr:hypothetical protein BRADI_1g22250v3 [Brachypodium distachyon]